MKISPVAISETSRPEPRVSTDPSDLNRSQERPFVAVMKDLREASDPAFGSQKAETGSAAGGRIQPEVPSQKPDRTTSSETGVEARQDGDSSRRTRAGARTASRTGSSETAKPAGSVPSTRKEDQDFSTPVLVAVAAPTDAVSEAEAAVTPAGRAAAGTPGTHDVTPPPLQLGPAQSSAGDIKTQEIGEARSPSVSDGPADIETAGERSMPVIEPSVASPNLPDSSFARPGIERRLGDVAGTMSPQSPATSQWRAPAASNPITPKQPAEPHVVDVAGLVVITAPGVAKDSAITRLSSERGGRLPPASDPRGSEAFATSSLKRGEEPSILRNSFAGAAAGAATVSKSVTAATGETPVATDNGVARNQLSPAGVVDKFVIAAQSDPRGDSGDRGRAGKLADSAFTGRDEDARPASGQPAAVHATENQAATRVTQPDPMPMAKETINTIVESGGVRKTNVGAKDYGPSLLAAAGGTSSGEMTTLSPTRPAPLAAGRMPELILQLADRIQVQLRNGENELRIQLKPELLGQLEIRAESGTSGILARIAAESVSVKEYLQNNLPTLHQSLQDQGLKIDRVEVVLQDAFDARQSAPQQHSFNQTGQGNGGAAHYHVPGPTAAQPAVSLDELIVDPMSWLALGPNSTFHTVA